MVEWSEDEGMIIGVGAPLEGHTRTVTALAVHDGLLYSSANDCTVRLWDGPQLLMTLAEGVDPFGSLSVLRDRIVIVPPCSQQQPHAAAYHHQPAHHDGHGRLHHASHDRSCACPHPFASPFVSEAATFVSGGGAARRLLDEPAGFPPLAQLPSDGIHGIRPAEIREISAEMGIEVEAAPDDTDEGTF